MRGEQAICLIPIFLGNNRVISIQGGNQMLKSSITKELAMQFVKIAKKSAKDMGMSSKPKSNK
jgi:hypothetical protein